MNTANRQIYLLLLKHICASQREDHTAALGNKIKKQNQTPPLETGLCGAQPLYFFSLGAPPPPPRAPYLDERVRQTLHPDPHGAVPHVALLRLLHRVPVHVDDFVKVPDQNLGHLK